MSSHDQLEENFTGTLDRELKDIRAGTEQQAQNLQEEYKSELQAAQQDFTATVWDVDVAAAEDQRDLEATWT